MGAANGSRAFMITWPERGLRMKSIRTREVLKPAAGAIVRRLPRTTSALMLGGVAALVTSVMWKPGDAAGHLALTVGVGAAYTIAGG